MRSFECILPLLLLVATFAAAQAPVTAPADAGEGTLPTMHELRQLHEGGDHRTCIQQAARVLRVVRAGGGEGYDVPAVQLIRGDCLLHTEDPVTAREAYAAAEASGDPNVTSEARAMALLIERSPELTYTPRTADAAGRPIPIVEHPDRRGALTALRADELAAHDALFRQAESADTLVPILEAVPRVLDVRSLELAATGDDEQTRPLATAVGARARELIAAELRTIDRRVAEIERTANTLIDSGGRHDYVTRRGLFSPDRKALRETIAYVRRIGRTAEEAQELARAYGGDPQRWDPIVASAAATLHRARQVLAHE